MQKERIKQAAGDAQQRRDDHSGSRFLDDLLFDGQTMRKQDQRRKHGDVRFAQRRHRNQDEDQRNGRPYADDHSAQPCQPEFRRQSDEVHHRRKYGRNRLDDAQPGQKLNRDGERDHDSCKKPVDVKRLTRVSKQGQQDPQGLSPPRLP